MIFVLTRYAQRRKVPPMTLRDARRAAKLTQAQLASKASVRQQLISRIECGDVHDPSHRAVMRICRALGVESAAIDEFRDGGRN